MNTSPMTVFDEAEKAHANLRQVANDFLAADEDLRIAQRNQTQALNNLNDAQKLFDAAVQSLRSASPFDSDWGITQQKLKEVAVMPVSAGGVSIAAVPSFGSNGRDGL